MTATTFTTSSAEARQVWSKYFQYQKGIDRRFQDQWAGSKGMPILRRTEEINYRQSKGYRATFNLRGRLATTEPRINSGGLTGAEKALSFYTDTVDIFLMKEAVITDTWSEQLTQYDLDMELMDALADLMGDHEENLFIKKLSGVTFTGNTGTGATGTANQTAGEAATTNTNILRPNSRAADADITSADVFSIALMRQANIMARAGLDSAGASGPWKMRPMKSGQFLCVINHQCMFALETDEEFVEAAHWSDVRGPNNVMYKYGDVIMRDVHIALHDSIYTAANGNGVTVATCLFMGQHAGIWLNAANVMFERSGKGGYKSDYFSHNLGAQMIIGFDKSTFNSLDWSVIAIKCSSELNQ